MDNKEILSKLRSVELCLTAHPHCEKGSEFEDRVFDLQEIQKALITLDVKNQKKLLIDFLVDQLKNPEYMAEAVVESYLNNTLNKQP